MRTQLVAFLLWYCVFAWASWAGGTLYQMLVIVPLWSSSPPASLRTFFQGTDYNRTIFRFFGPPFMMARTLPVLLALALAWEFPLHRLALAIAAACIVSAVVFTVLFIYPINAVLFNQAGAELSDAESRRLVNTWILADRIRFVVGLIALTAILWAFRLPLSSA